MCGPEAALRRAAVGEVAATPRQRLRAGLPAAAAVQNALLHGTATSAYCAVVQPRGGGCGGGGRASGGARLQRLLRHTRRLAADKETEETCGAPAVNCKECKVKVIC